MALVPIRIDVNVAMQEYRRKEFIKYLLHVKDKITLLLNKTRQLKKTCACGIFYATPIMAWNHLSQDHRLVAGNSSSENKILIKRPALIKMK